MYKRQVRDCIQNGIAKVNFATELRITYTQAIQRYLKQNSGVTDPKKYGAAGRDAVRELVRARMQVCGCAGKAGRV